MKQISRSGLAFFLLSAVLATAVCLQARDPLAGQVSIYRDEYGVPHIVGETEEATFFGYGYAQAQDHLEKMMLQYRDAQGRRAEILGFEALGDGYLRFIPHEYRWDGDYLQRLLRTKRTVVDHRDQIDPQVYRILSGFARGVNAYIEEHRADVPAWIDGITPEDVEALERSQYLRFYSIHEALSKLTDLPHSFPNLGSNQFAIAREKSADGHIIHVEHTHMPWDNRFQNYEAHLITPGKLDTAGISWFGSPFFLDGLNDKITWSATWNTPNISDVYEEKLNPRNSLQYLYEGAWREITVSYETFRIKGPQGLETLTLPCYYTHHGPIVKFEKERHRAYAVKLPNYDGVNYSTNLYRFMKAGNLADFKAVVALHLMPRWNLLYTDRENLYWVHNANVAERADGFDWRQPVPGWVKATEWGPYLPLEKYPQLLNPPSGFIQNCNNPPWLSTVNSGLAPLDPVPYYLISVPKPEISQEDLNPRGERLLKVLAQDKRFTLEEMKSLAYDTYVVPADVIVPLLTRAFERKQGEITDPHIHQAIAILKSWDRRSAADSVAQTDLYFWAQAYRDLFSSVRLSRFLAYTRYDLNLESREEQDMALQALEEALRRIEKDFGKPEVAWGAVNTVERGGTFAMDGTGVFDVLHPDDGPQQEDGRIHDNDGWGHLLVVEESDPKRAWSLLPYGESEDPASPHYNDMTKLHSQRSMKPLWLTPQEILAHTESVWGDKDRLKRYLPASQSH
ncbi:MAG: penicillin acylase family protein [Terriglobia bacterium]|jgi:acyl-homoserine lactone acylase PvdQ